MVENTNEVGMLVPLLLFASASSSPNIFLCSCLRLSVQVHFKDSTLTSIPHILTLHEVIWDLLLFFFKYFFFF